VDRDANWWKGDNSVIYFSLSDPAGNVLATQPGCQIGRVALPATGTYTMTSSQGVGAYRVPIRFVRHDRVRTIAYGAIVSGTIEQPGAHDLYTFTAKAGDLIQLSGKGCVLGNLSVGVVRPDHSVVAGPGCNEGSGKKIDQDGTYQLLVNWADNGTGKYQFVFQGVSGGR
jgi:hypothetical protein